jgi:hypothetical protein
MTVAALVFVVAFLAPAFIRSWSLALFAVAVQAACGMSLGFAHGLDFSHVGSWIAVADAELRIAVGPWLLFLAARPHASQRFELVPLNMIYWLLVAVSVGLGFSVARSTSIIDPLTSYMLVGAVASGILFAMFVLSVERRIAGQVIAVLTFENSLFLFENSLQHHLAVALRVGLAAIYALTVLAFAYFLRHESHEKAER